MGDVASQDPDLDPDRIGRLAEAALGRPARPEELEALARATELYRQCAARVRALPLEAEDPVAPEGVE
jgi:hypothetical protein